MRLKLHGRKKEKNIRNQRTKSMPKKEKRIQWLVLQSSQLVVAATCIRLSICPGRTKKENNAKASPEMASSPSARPTVSHSPGNGKNKTICQWVQSGCREERAMRSRAPSSSSLIHLFDIIRFFLFFSIPSATASGVAAGVPTCRFPSFL